MPTLITGSDGTALQGEPISGSARREERGLIPEELMFRRLCAFLLSAAAVLCACRGAPHCLALSPGAAARSQDAANAAPQDPFAGYPLRNAVVLTRELDTDGGSIFAETGFGRSEAGSGIYAYVQIPGRRYFCLGKTRHPGTVSGGRMICDIALEGSGGTIRRHDGAEWRPEPLRSTELGQGMYFIRTDRQADSDPADRIQTALKRSDRGDRPRYQVIYRKKQPWAGDCAHTRRTSKAGRTSIIRT